MDVVRVVTNSSAVLVQAGDYTVLYTSGLKQFNKVDCARIRYTHGIKHDEYKYYTHVKADGTEENLEYDVVEVAPATFSVTSKDDESVQYVKYHDQDILLIYWCKPKGDDYYYNNVWIIASRTPQAGTQHAKASILGMLYHDDYRGLIDRDLEDVRDEKSRYVELSTCSENIL